MKEKKDEDTSKMNINFDVMRYKYVELDGLNNKKQKGDYLWQIILNK